MTMVVVVVVSRLRGICEITPMPQGLCGISAQYYLNYSVRTTVPGSIQSKDANSDTLELEEGTTWLFFGLCREEQGQVVGAKEDRWMDWLVDVRIRCLLASYLLALHYYPKPRL